MKEGGYQVLFTGSQTVYGTYGGEQGQVLTPAEELGYNFFSTNFCEHTPTIILCGSIIQHFVILMDLAFGTGSVSISTLDGAW